MGRKEKEFTKTIFLPKEKKIEAKRIFYPIIPKTQIDLQSTIYTRETCKLDGWISENLMRTHSHARTTTNLS